MKKETSYDANVPWLGLGHNVSKAKTTKQLLKAAGIDWEVHKHPLAYSTDSEYIDFKNHYALVRSSDESVLDVCGSRYIPTQNEQAFDLLMDFIHEGKATFETAGSLNRGRIVWGMAKLNTSFTLPGNDRVQGYLFVGVPHMQGRSLIARVTTLRDACNNTISIALRTSKKTGGGDIFRMNHRNIFDAVQLERAKEVLGAARDQVGNFEKQARVLHKMKLSKNDVIKTLAPIFQPKDTYKDIIADPSIMNSKLDAIMEAYTLAPGAQPGTAWGALNAVTYWADHVASRTADKRLTNAWTGRTANQKEQVLHALLELA